MAGMDSCGESAGGSSATISGIRSLSYRIRLRRRSGQPSHGRNITTRHCSLRSLAGRLDLPFGCIYIQLRDFGLDLGLEFITGALKLVERLAHLPPDLGQLLRPKDDQGNHEDEH